MAKLLTRKLFLLLFVVPLLHALGFYYGTTYPNSERVIHVHGDLARPDTADYIAYAQQVLAGDLGKVGVAEISDIIYEGIRNSFVLLVLALLLTILSGPLLGLISISQRTRRLTPLALFIMMGGASLPGFFLGVAIIALMIYGVFNLGTGRLPLPISGYGLDEHLILPTFVLAAGPTLHVARITAGMLEHELQQDYVRVALSKGLSWRRIFLRHALPNILPAVVLTIGRSVRFLLSGLIVVEALFLWPGLGRILTYAIGIRIDGREPVMYFLDPHLLATLAMIFGTTLLLADLVTSIIVYACDPRISQAPLEHQNA